MASFNDFMQGMVKGADEIAQNISNSGFYKNVVPTKEGFAQELAHGIGSNQKAKISFIQSNVDDMVRTQTGLHLRKSGLTADQVETISNEMINALHGTDYSDEAFAKLGDIMKKHQIDESVIGKFTKMAPGEVQSIINNHSIDASKMNPTLYDGLSHPLMYAKTYFNNPDPKVRNHRIAAVAGTYGAVTVGGRLLSGGTLTEDNYGRRDIAGVPFI